MSNDQITLRNYQREAIDAVFEAWINGMKRPAIVLPTGAGKTVVFSALVKQFNNPGDVRDYLGVGRRVIILAHRDELVDQAIAKLRAVLPEDVSVGKVKAGDNEISADVMVCSVQTLASKRRLDALVGDQHSAYGPVGLIITDECHHAAAASYKKIYEAFPDALQLGVTATMARGDGVGLGSVWEDVVYSRSILNLISKGHLTDVRTRRVELKGLNLGDVKASRGDYQSGDLGRALMESEAEHAIASAYKEHAGTRQGIVFTPTVETAWAAAEQLNMAGVKTAVVDGETSRDTRQAAYEMFRTGQVQVLANCMVLTEGFDAPWAEVAVIARPTQSAPLYTQMVGRVLRPWPGKKEALVLDLVGASANKLRTLIDLDPGSVQTVRDGETLAEAVVREAEEANKKVPAGSLAFELKVKEVNSFAGSKTAWVRTPKGVMFINCGETYVFLWPSSDHPGLWDVCVALEKKRPQKTKHVGLDIGSAMAWGEAVSEDYYGGFGVGRDAPWRNKKPSEAMASLGRALGIESPSDLRAGELSDRINEVKGARYFDKHVKG